MTGPQVEGEEDTKQHEIVIIRRRGNGEEAAHHGGVWKIAHADFMTALMAFFLVMWLINATDEKTAAGIANYFNPMRLTDTAAKPKGVFNIEPGGDSEGAESKAPEHEKKPKKKRSSKESDKGKDKDPDAALLSDPIEELDKIAAQAGHGTPEKENAQPHQVGDAFRDPFDPDLRYQMQRPGAGGPHAGETAESNAASPPGKSEAAERPSPAVNPNREAEINKAAAELQREIEAAVMQSGFAAVPGIEVKATIEGVLINITDQPNFEMFGIASALPKPELVVLMDKIGKIINERPEQIVIRGHTDSRPYRTNGYDNWRLSSSRAQVAYYMLVRGGLGDPRVSRIEGHADHDLNITSNPLASENRRIEILLVKGRP